MRIKIFEALFSLTFGICLFGIGQLADAVLSFNFLYDDDDDV
jgi:hypothetical protein